MAKELLLVSITMKNIKIEINFDDDKIRIDRHSYDLWRNYVWEYQNYFFEYTRISSELRKQFLVEGYNYNNIIRYLIYEPHFYFKKSPGMALIFNYLNILDKIKDKKRNIDVDIYDFYNDAFKKCAIIYGEKQGIKVRIGRESYLKRNLNFIYETQFIVRNLIKARIFLRYLLGKIRLLSGKNNKKKCEVLFLSNIRFSKKREDENIMFGSLIKELDKNIITNKVLRYEPLTQTTNLNRFIKDFIFQNEAYIGDYYSLKHFSKCNKDFKLLKKRWEEIKDKQEFKDIFVYKGYNFYDIIKPRLEMTFNALSYIACDNKNITEEIIKREDYKVLVLDHEENMYGKGFMLNTRNMKNKKTVALSHELIYPGCIHTHIHNKEVMNKKSDLWRPLPDIKFVWGDYSKKILVETCNYSGRIIKVTGNPKFDPLFKRKYEKSEILYRFKLDKKRKRILVASQMDRYSQNIYMDIARKNKDIDIIIKPHQGDDVNKLNESLKGHPDNLKLVDKYADLYSLIYVSDYLITYNSTTGFEAMIMGKIVFILNPNKDTLLGLPYVESGAAIEIYSANDLTNELKKLSDKKYKDKILDNMKKFVKNMHYKNDGKASERVADEIIKILKFKS